MRFNQVLVRIICSTALLSFIFVLNVFAGLTESERSELKQLQLLVEKNADMSEAQMQRWEELLLKDPDNLKKLRQKEIDKWKAELRAEGEQIDQSNIDRQLESEWNDFLVEKDEKIINLNEQNVVLFLRKIRDFCRIEKQNKVEYPLDLNTLILDNNSSIESELYSKIKKIYKIQYEKIFENYRVWAFPLESGKTGRKSFLLENNTIFFTLDGSKPTLNSNRIL
ncbi:MAG: hypothetical protein KJ915_12200 [Candidatus Omnitrophica bacterium]|nr:hypothetical protein [Candidatus Omnitrophota bacterium]